MKKIGIFFFVLALFILTANAKPIDLKTARTVGTNFILNRVNLNSPGKDMSLELVYISSSKKSKITESAAVLNYFYVFNINKTEGFVIVSADDIVWPIIGYSNEKEFVSENIPEHVQKSFDNYANQISYAIANGLLATGEIETEWKILLNGTHRERIYKKGATPFLVKSRWNQLPYYNDLCPISDNRRAVTGCVATAMAQIMEYWDYPVKGSGSHSYTHGEYGKLSANFDSTYYDWFNMPYTISAPNANIAQLMYHCGVSVDMGYNPDGSAAAVFYKYNPGGGSAELAFKTHFGYKSTIKGVERKNYNETEWLNLLKSEIDSGRPILYVGGGGSRGPHAYVVDGYENISFLHCNWGWGGWYNGYYSVNALNPGTDIFTNQAYALIKIEPAQKTIADLLNITVDVKASASPIYNGQGFSVSTNIINKNKQKVYGTYCAAMFDKDYNLVEYIDTINESKGLYPNATYNNNLVFNFNTKLSIYKGINTIEIFYRPFGGQWRQLKSTNSSIQHRCSVEVIYPNYIEINSEMKLDTKALMVEDPLSVSLNVVNKYRPTFYGKYRLSLFNMDSTLAEIIDTIDETKGLTYNSIYKTPLIFKTSEIKSTPGKYILALQFMVDSTNEWVMAGSKYFKNLIEANVLSRTYSPDKYEVNNDFDQAYSLPFSFIDNKVEITTQGSNFNRKTDYDYYKIVLQGGYNYTISARVRDIKSIDGAGYTADAWFRVVKDGAWFDINDDSLSDKIKNTGSTTIYFIVTPDSSDGMGTYLLDIDFSRVSLSAKSILSFSVNNMVDNPIIDENSATVKVTVGDASDITSLAPSISISELATINPASGIIRNFTSPVSYTVTAKDMSKKVWTVTLMKKSVSVPILPIDKTNVIINPNPASDIMKVNHNGTQVNTEQLKVTDLLGKFREVPIVLETSNTYSIDVSMLNNGLYILILDTDNGIVHERFHIRR